MNIEIAKIDAMRRTQRGAQRAAWDAIKNEAPDVAVFLTQVSAAFGKPAAVRVVIDKRVVVEKGVLLPARQSRFDPPGMR